MLNTPKHGSFTPILSCHEEVEAPDVLELNDADNMRRFIFDEPAVIRRLEQRSVFEDITSNGTVAAAVMVLAAILAVVVANSPAYAVVEETLMSTIGFTIGPLTVDISFEAFVNDALMAVFFLLVGIELKYEMTVGQLRRPRQAALPRDRPRYPCWRPLVASPCPR